MVIAAIALLFLLIVMAIARLRAPRIDTQFGGATIHLSADRALIVLPGECALLKWDVEGIQSIYLDGRGKIG